MQNKPQIVIVEDEVEIRRFLEAAISAAGYTVKAACGVKDALKMLGGHPPDLIILDLGLPDGDGKDVIRGVREWSHVPIIVLSARDQESEKVAALDLGADDYLTKPFGPAELVARIKVALRRAAPRSVDGSNVVGIGELVLSPDQRQVALAGEVLHLTPTEYDLLSALIAKAGQVVTQGELLREVWGKNSIDHDHYLRIYVQRLRQKLKDDPLKPRYIFTEPGIGYRFSAD